MITDGEKVKLLFSKAKYRVVVCAPYVKLSALKSLTTVIPSGVDVDVFMCLRAMDIYLGVSDIEVFDYCEERARFRLFNISNLHAKLYSADDEVLIGSANVTNSALGWVANPNVEILSPSSWGDPSVSRLVLYMKTANLITEDDVSKILEEVRALDGDAVKEIVNKAMEVSSDNNGIWLPKSSMPHILHSVYDKSINKKHYTVGAIEDAVEDIAALNVPDNLKKSQFYEFVGLQLGDFVIFGAIINEIPKKLDEPTGIKIIRSFDAFLDQDECRLHWNNIILWIGEFLGDVFEVAPVSFEIRLR
jgi:hypothetical protein